MDIMEDGEVPIIVHTLQHIIHTLQHTITLIVLSILIMVTPERHEKLMLIRASVSILDLDHLEGLVSALDQDTDIMVDGDVLIIHHTVHHIILLIVLTILIMATIVDKHYIFGILYFRNRNKYFLGMVYWSF